MQEMGLFVALSVTCSRGVSVMDISFIFGQNKNHRFLVLLSHIGEVYAKPGHQQEEQLP